VDTEDLCLPVLEKELLTSERERLAFAERRITELELQLAFAYPEGSLRTIASKMMREKDMAVRILAERLKTKTRYSGSVDNIITSAYMEAASRNI